MNKGKDFLSQLFNGVVEGITVSAITGFKKTAEEAGGNFLKARFGNLGSNDEHLFNAACTLALSNNLISLSDLLRVCKVIDGYSNEQRARIVGIIGKMESEVTTERNLLDSSGNIVYDKKGDPLKEKQTEKGNLQGAETIAMLGKMTDDEIRDYFAASGMSVTISSKIKEGVEKTAEKIENSQFKADGDSFFSQPSALEKFCNSIGVII